MLMRFDTHDPMVILELHKVGAPNRCNPQSVMNKAAQVSLVFWVMKICATTLGETSLGALALSPAEMSTSGQ